MNQLDWIIRNATSSDFEQIGQISKYGNSDRRSATTEYFIWKLLDNPVQQGLANVADHNGKIISSTTITPKYIALNGVLTKGAEIGDTYTVPDFQRKGIFAKLVNKSRTEATDNYLSFIYGTPNNNSLPGYEKKCNFVKINSIKIEMLIRPMNFVEISKIKISSKMFLRILAPVASILFMLVFPFSFKNKSTEDFLIRKLPGEFPKSIDNLAEMSISIYEGIIFRDKKYLDWRFVQNPDQYDIWIAERNNEAVGYIVCKIGFWNNLRVGYLADFFIADDNKTIFNNLLYEASKYLQNCKVDMIAAWAVRKTRYSSILKRNGFLKAWDLPLICYNNKWYSETLRVNTWHFTMADSDNI